MPSAKYCPSFDHLALRIFAPTLCFVTLLAVELQSPKSPSVHDASWSQQGLCATTCGATVECVARRPRTALGTRPRRDTKRLKIEKEATHDMLRVASNEGTARDAASALGSTPSACT